MNQRFLVFLLAVFTLLGGGAAFLMLRDIPAPQTTIEKPVTLPGISQ